MQRTTYDKDHIKPLYAEDAPWCEIVSDGRHSAQMCLAFWDTPAGPMCNYHAMQGWPDLFITKTISNTAEAELDNA